jgi:RHS repeat-associated protein
VFAYGAGGRLSTVQEQESSRSFSYNSLGQLIAETRTLGAVTATIGYGYNNLTGDLVSMTYPSGSTLTYARNQNGQISAMQFGGQPLATGISRLSFGPVKSAALGSLTLNRSYDQRYQVAAIQAGAMHLGYTRDAAGQVATITGIEEPAATSGTESFTIDPISNRLTAAGAVAYTYDDSGNLTSDGVHIYTWDALNRLVKVEQGSAVVATYGYDSQNRRIRKTVGSKTILYHYCKDNLLIAETLADGTTLREYVYLDGEPLALREYETNPGLYYYLNDHLGTPQQLVKPDGRLVWKAAYLPYGQAQVRTSTLVNNLRFPGQYFDQEIGLHYNWNRYYNPSTGRYLSPDPIGLYGGLNFYAYVGGNPVSKTDPWGLEEYSDNFIGPLPRNGYRTSEMTQTKCGRVSPSPPGANIDANMRLADNSWNPGWFYNQVRNGGPWDYKQSGSRYEDFGNFNFGATGSAFGFPSQVLKRGAGWANQKADPTRTGIGSPYGIYPYGDDPKDQEQIEKGINYCECMGY